MILTIELPGALAEMVHAHGVARSLTDAEAVQDLLRERLMPIDLDELEASLLDPTPGDAVPLTKEYIDAKIARLRTLRERRAAS